MTNEDYILTVNLLSVLFGEGDTVRWIRKWNQNEVVEREWNVVQKWNSGTETYAM